MHISGLNFREWEWRQTWGISSIVFCVSKIKKNKGKREIVTLQKIIYEENKENLASKKSTRKKQKKKKKAKWPAVAGKRTPVTGAET